MTNKPSITKHYYECHFCQGKGCDKCDNTGQVTAYYTIIDSKGNAFNVDTLK